MKDNKDFDNWYKKKVTENDQDPPEGAWQNISDELDVNDVWNRISVELDTPRGWSVPKAIYYSVPVLLLLLFSGGAYYYFTRTTAITPESTHLTAEAEVVGEAIEEVGEVGKVQEVGEMGDVGEGKRVNDAGHDNENPATTGNFVPGTTKTLVPEDINKENLATAETLVPRTNETLVVEDDNEEARGTDETLITGGTGEVDAADIAEVTSRTKQEGSADGAQTEWRAVTLVDKNPALIGDDNERRKEEVTTGREGTIPSQRRVTAVAEDHAGIATVIVPDSMLIIYPVTVRLHSDSLDRIAVADARQKLMYDKTIEFGLTASVKNTWLLNRMTLMGLERHTLNTTVPDFGKDIGMVFAYNFSPAFSAQAEGMFISEAGQRYKEYRNGKYVDREADLRYYTVHLLLKYNRNEALFLNGHSLVGGLYASMLNKATETINGRVSESNAYKNYNYGVILGYEYNRFVMPNLLISSGLRVNYGFPNIDGRLFSKTFTGSLDLNIAVKYRLKAK